MLLKKAAVLSLLLLLSAAMVRGQEPEPSASVPLGPRRATLLFGIGNAMGWLGAQGEKYVAGERWSVFAGLGYVPAFEDNDPSGVAFALGARAFTKGARHRGFAEASVSLVGFVEYADPAIAAKKRYGPGLQLGYQYVARGGFTAMVSTGLGFAIETEPGVSSASWLAGIGIGYTWRR